jgi:hypothetical protein
MDPNVVGRMRIEGVPEPPSPAVRIITTLALSSASDGNGAGVGLADIISLRLLRGIDFAATYVNLLTAGLAGVRRGHIPVVLPTDREAVLAGLQVCGRSHGQALRIVRIRNTLELSETLISCCLSDEVQKREGVEVLPGEQTVEFDATGTIGPWPEF